jgi:hypothetical protein
LRTSWIRWGTESNAPSRVNFNELVSSSNADEEQTTYENCSCSYFCLSSHRGNMPNAEMPMPYQYFLDAPLRWWRRSRDVVIPTRMSINASELQYEVPRADSGDETIATVTTEIAHDVSFYRLENSLQLLFRLTKDFTELPVCISRGSPRASNSFLSANRIINMKLRTANVKMSGPWSGSLLARRPPLFCLVSNAAFCGFDECIVTHSGI